MFSCDLGSQKAGHTCLRAISAGCLRAAGRRLVARSKSEKEKTHRSTELETSIWSSTMLCSYTSPGTIHAAPSGRQWVSSIITLLITLPPPVNILPTCYLYRRYIKSMPSSKQKILIMNDQRQPSLRTHSLCASISLQECQTH